MTFAFVAVLALLVIAAGLLVVLWGKYKGYRATYTKTDGDVKSARRDNSSRSRSNHMGHIQEHLAPMFPSFAERYSFRDAQHIGGTVDYLIYDGLEAGEVKQIVLLEVKTGSAQYNDRQRLLRKAVSAGIPVRWDVLRLDQLPDTEMEIEGLS